MAGLHTNQENGFDFGIAKDHEDQVEFHHECSRGFLNQHFNFYIAFGLNDFFRRHDIRFCIFTLLKKTFSTVEIELIIVFFSQTTFFRRQACFKERRKVASVFYHHANKEQYISNKVTREPIPLRLEAKLYSNFKGLIK